MYLVQILLPLYDNNDAPVPRTAHDEVRHELTQQFGGVTAFLRAPGEGFWKEDGQHVSRDDVVVMEVMTDRLDREWWGRYKKELEEGFRQQEIVIRAITMEKL